MNLNISYDATTLSTAPSGFFSAVNYVVNLFNATFTANVTVNIQIGYGTFPYDNSAVPALGESMQNNLAFVNYGQAARQLVAEGAPGAATLPGTAPLSGSLVMGSAQEKALGLIGPSSTLDGWVGIASNATLNQQTGGSWSFSPTATPGSNQYYIVGTLEHEITEVMGRISYLNVRGEYGVMDLYRYAGAGVRQTGTGDASYFSVNGGVSNLDSFNNFRIAGTDLGDWAPRAGPSGVFTYAGADAFNAYSNPGLINGLSATDLTVMAALGWNQPVSPGSPAGPTNPASPTTPTSPATTPSFRLAGTGDFAGTGQAGLLYAGGGNAVVALRSGTGFAAQAVSNAHMGFEWTVAGTGDFTREGNTDILWASGSGQVAIWQMNGAQLAGYSVPAGQMGPEWNVTGVADFNGDGNADILWENGTGNLAVWTMNGTALAGFGIPNGHMGLEWHVAAVGDFNGDGAADALWSSGSGQVAAWLLHGGNLVGFNGNVGALGTEWHVAGVGNFNGDNTSDVAWVNGNNDVQIWYMASGGIGQIVVPAGHNGLEWHAAGVADASGDGLADLLWLNNAGSSQIWQLNGSQVSLIQGSAPVSGALSAGQPVDPAELVTQLYNDVLGRAPDTEGLAAWTNALDNGWSLPELRSAFAHSPEAQGDLAQFYDQVLGRAADDSGIAAWTGALENGASLIGVRSLFAYSQEAATDLTALFQNAEGRLPDMAELAGMQDRLMPFGATLSGVAADLAANGPTGFTVSTVPDGDLLLEAEESPNAFDFSSWGFGNVTIEEFAPNQDAIRLDHNLAGDFASVESHMSSNGGATVIAFDSSHTLTLEDVAPSSLTSANFHIV